MSSSILTPKSQKQLKERLQDHDHPDEEQEPQIIVDKPNAINPSINTNNSVANADNNQSDNISNQRIDTFALNGLRGIIAVHIMIFHSILFSKLKLNTLGSVQMPLFFLISGFILALNDGKNTYLPTKCCTEFKSYSNNDNNHHYNGKNFYQRRIARTIPLYYLTNIICIPLIYAGYSWIQPGISEYICYILTVFAATTWLGSPTVLNGPSWFVSTIWFFYWIFPSLLPKLQIYTNERKQKWIKYHYWIQLVVGIVLFIGFIFVPGLNGSAFYIATFWPVSRLPLFIMGILLGLLRNELNAMDLFKTLKTETLAIGFMIFFVLGSIIENLTGGLSGFNLWGQLVLPWWQLQLIFVLTSENESNKLSKTYKVLTSKWMLYLGRISYSLYLIHLPLMDYICWIMYGTQQLPDCEYDYDQDIPCNDEWDTYNDHRLIPIWCIPIHCIVSFIFAIVLNRFVEEPMRKWLRPKK